MKKIYTFMTALLVSMLLIPWQLNAQVLLNENFDNITSGVPENWIVEGTSYDASSSYYNNAWKSTEDYYGWNELTGWDGTPGLYFNCYSVSTGGTAILKTPVLDLTSSTKDMMLTFNLYDADEDEIKVYVSTDGGETYEDNLLLTCEKLSSWQTIELSLAAYKNQANVRIVWYGVSAWGNSRPVLDNIMVAPAPTCAQAENMTATEIDQEGALLSWKLAEGKGAAAETYELNVYAVGAETATVTATLTADDYELADGVYSYFVEGLASGSQYYFTVKGICGADDEAVVAQSANFYTLCNAYELPLVVDSMSAEALLPCWTMNDADMLSGTLYLNSQNSYLVTPQLNFAANNIEARVKYTGDKVGNGFYYGIASDATLADFDTLGFVKINKTYADHVISVNTANTEFGAATGKVFAIRSNGYMYLYEIDLHEKPCCPRVEQPTASAIDSASVNVGWLGTASSYNVVLKDTVTNNEITRTTTENPFVFDGLASQTTYLVLVQAVCEGCEASSEWSDSIYVTTLCGAAEEAAFTESFEYEELGSVMPECWVQNRENQWQVTHRISYYDTPNNAADGYSAIYMYHDYNWLKGSTATFSPQPFNVATAGQYDVSFAMYRYNKSYYSTDGDGTLTVWANNRPDTVGAVKVATIERYYTCEPVEKAEGWYYYDFNIPQVTGTVYLVFEGENNSINYLYLDDIKVYPAPTCRKVRNIELAGDPTTESVSLKWLAEEGQTQWVVDYAVVMGTDTVKTDSVPTEANPFVIDGLNHSTAYKVVGTVQGYCSETDRAEAIPFEFDFNTACLAVSTFPYFEGFENAFPPMCWDMKNTAGNANFVWQQYESSQYVKEGNYCAYYSYKTSGSKAILVTPEFTFPAGETYRLELYAYRGTSGSSYTGEGIGIYVSSTREVTETSTLLAFIPRLTDETSEAGLFPVAAVETAGMHQYKFDFSTDQIAELGGKYLIFEALTKDGYYQSFDNLWIGPKPAIDVITSFTIDSVVVDAARIKIPDQTVEMFDLAYYVKGTTDTVKVENIAGREYSLTGLAADTEYEAVVRARNAAGQVSEWSRTAVGFRTLCSAFAVTEDTPFIEDFESYAANVTEIGCMIQSYASSYYMRVAENMEYYDSDSWNYITKYPAQGSRMAYASSAAGEGSWLFRAVELEAGQNYSISVDALECSSYDEATIAFGYATTPDRSAVTKCLSGYVIPDRTDWERVTGYFTVPEDGVYYVGVGVEYGSSTVGLDSLVIRTESVIPPMVNITELTDAKVTFELNSTAAYWEMYYSTSNFSPDTIEEGFVQVENTTYSIENLTANTTYYYAFRSYDEEDNASSWTAVGNFKTACGATALPLQFGFESLSFDCWTLNTVDGDKALRAYGNHSGYCWNMYGTHELISPKVDGDLSNCEGSFWAVGQYDGERYVTKFLVGVMTNPVDATTFKAVTDTITITGVQGNGDPSLEYTFSFESLKEDAVYKDAKYVVLKMIQGYAYVDEFVVKTLPTCRRPSNLEATEITANTITLDWTAGATGETSWSVMVKQGADTVKTVVTDVHPVTIEGLTGNTTYNFALRALCAANDSSEIVELNGVTTLCDVYALPYANDLNGFPPCWTVEDNNLNDAWSWNSYSGVTQLVSYQADTYDCDTARLHTAEFVFDGKYNVVLEMYTYFETGTFNVLFDNGTTRDTLLANFQNHNAWDTVTIDMAAYEGQTGRLVFEGWGPQQTTGYSAYWMLRNFSIEAQPVVYENPVAPVFNPAGGEYVGSVDVTLTCESENVIILYDLLGLDPNFTSPRYDGTPITLTENTNMTAVAVLVDDAGEPIMNAETEMPYMSEVVRASYVINPEVTFVEAPVFTPAPGDYLDQESLSVGLTCATPNAKIYWAYGEDPTVNQYSFEYVGGIPVTATDNVISAVAIIFDENSTEVKLMSEVVYATYNLKQPEQKEVEIIFSPEAGEYTGEVSVTIEYLNAEDAGMKLYSIDGTDPMREYRGAIKLTESATVKARVMYFTSPFSFSETFEATYIITPTGPTVDVDNAELVAMVYAREGVVYVSAEVGTMIEVFTVQGQCIYAGEAISNLTSIDALQADVVLVKVAGEVVKVSVK